MILKLAKNNIKSSIKDVTVYFFTLVFCIAIYFTFNSIIQNPQLMKHIDYAKSGLDNLTAILRIASIFIIIIIGALIVYSNWYFLKHRKYEFGIYLTLGIRKEQIIGILLIENLVIGVIAIGIGILLGILGSQFMTAILLKVYGTEINPLGFIISKYSLVSTITNFGIVFIISVIVNTIAVFRLKIIDLVYSKSDMEKVHTKDIKTTVLLLFFGFIMLCTGYFMAILSRYQTTEELLGEIIFGTMGTIGIFIALATMFEFYVKRREKRYFKGINIFTFSQITNRINSSSIVMAVVCLTMFVSSIVFMVGNTVKSTFEDKATLPQLYDISKVILDSKNRVHFDVYDLLSENLKKKIPKKRFVQIDVKQKEYDLKGLPNKYKADEFQGKYARFLSQKDFNKCVGAFGDEQIEIGENEYIFGAEGEKQYKFGKMLVENKVKLKVGNKTYTPIGVRRFRMDNIIVDRKIFITRDTIKGTIDNHRVVCSVNTGGDVNLNKEIEKEISGILKRNLKQSYDNSIDNLLKKDEIIAAAIAGETFVTCLFLYISLILMVACGAVISIQQLLQVDESTTKYKILRYLGADEKILNRSLLKQISFYFGIPLIFAVIDLFVGFVALRELIERYGDYDIYRSLLGVTKFILLTYGTYFLLTYFSCKKIIYRKMMR